MTEADKNLLLIDLCSRLPYGVKVEAETWLEDEGEFAYVPDKVYSINSDGYIVHGYDEVYECKPYLFPMSSMTEEQGKIYHELIGGMFGTSALINFELLEEFFNKNHLDYRGLIPKGLAIDCTNLNIY